MLPSPTFVIQSEPSCSKCIIEIRHALALGTAEERALSGMPAHMARALDGSIYIIDQVTRLPRVYDTEGRFVRSLGRKGDGPGEYQDASAILIGSDGRVHILDLRLNRRTILSPTGEVIATLPLGSGAPMMASAALLPNNGIVTNRILLDAEGAGFAFQEMDATGKRVRLFSEGAFDINWLYDIQRLLFVRKNGELWTARPYSYVLELYTEHRALQRTYERAADWFKPLARGENESGGFFDRPPTPNMRAIWEDDAGVLWTATIVTSVSWTPGPTIAAWRAAGRPPSSPPQERWDTILEAIDPTTGALLAGTRVGAFVVHDLFDGYLASYREASDGTPAVDVWQVRLRTRQ